MRNGLADHSGDRVAFGSLHLTDPGIRESTNDGPVGPG
jgi:hypothetical protein